MRRIHSVFIGLGLLGAHSVARAAPTGLNTIPTADLVPEHQYTFSLQNGNDSLQDNPTVFDHPQLVYQTQFGISNKLEGGVDAVPNSPPDGDYRPQFNLKWRPMAEDYGHPALAAGVDGVGNGFAPTYYLVASRTLNYNQMQYMKFRAHHRNNKLRGKRVHVGIIRTPFGTFPMVGSDIQMSDNFVFYTDWISGSQNAVSLGGVYAINQVSSMQAALLYGNHESRINGVLFNYSRTLAW